MRHPEVLDKIKVELSKDDNVLALLVFGSVAKGTFRRQSDIDLSIIYKVFEPGFEFSKGEVDGVEVGYSRWSIQKLNEYVKQKPYRGYVFANAKILFDNADIESTQKALLNFFADHPDIRQVWIKLEQSYKEGKQKHGKGQTDIFEVYKELDTRYGNGNNYSQVH